MAKREAPYTRLKRKARGILERVVNPKTRQMWVYPKASVEAGTYPISKQLYERVAAADQIGYDVRLRPRNGDLVVEYVERHGVTHIPYEFRD